MMGHPIEADSSTEYWAEAGCSSSRGLYVNGGFDSQAGCVMQLSLPYADVPKFSNGQPSPPTATRGQHEQRLNQGEVVLLALARTSVQRVRMS